MSQLFAIAVGGAFGALMRFFVSTGTYLLLGRGFPYGTLMVNVLGSLLMGALFVVLSERLALGPEWRAGLLVGLLGAFTTFSTFSLETLVLLEEGRWLTASANVFVSVLLCLLATWIGLTLARHI